MGTNNTSWEQLQADILNGLDNAMKKKVAPIVEKKLYQNAQSATGEYSRASGGIGDRKNVVSEVKRKGETVKLLTKDVAKPNDWFGTYQAGRDPYETIFSQWVSLGEWHELPLGSGIQREARPFVEITQEEVNNSNEIINALKSEFK